MDTIKVFGLTLGDLFSIITGVIFVAKLVTMSTPTQVDDKYINIILGIFNFLALNIFKDKNADAVLKLINDLEKQGATADEIVSTVKNS